MHKLLALLGLLALPLSAETYEARSPHHAIALESKGAGEYAIRVTDLDTNQVLMTSTMRGAHTATEKRGEFVVSVEARETPQHMLIASVRVNRNGETVDLFEGFWQTVPRPLNEVPITGPLRVGGEIKPPMVIHRVEPLYTAKGRSERIEGIVLIEATIDHTGHVRDARILKPLPDGLDQAAIDAVMQWTFEPATLHGKPVDVLYNLSLVFRLK